MPAGAEGELTPGLAGSDPAPVPDPPASSSDIHWMREALAEARQCLRSSPPASNGQSSIVDRQCPDVPVGAVCVHDGRVIGRGQNRREVDGDPTAHAEVLALRAAAQALGQWRLEGVTLYVTLEPCPMCAGAIWLARPDRVVFGAWDPAAGAAGSLFDILRDPRLNHRPQVRGGVLEEECAALLKSFFREVAR
jgi:tRNA(adenine34) deaminase